ncbi:hypothetical protein [Pseudomonas sp. NPDC096950]|uniref:hypothetical protein n=1 Tax=Pseudomonas sp. NPDC096950 TaxID=3364485 RepID=UPI00383B9869
MLIFIAELVLFVTAVTASRVCAAHGHQFLGFIAAIVLECGYLLMGVGTWWMGVLFVAVGTLIVLWCLNHRVTPKSAGVGNAS